MKKINFIQNTLQGTLWGVGNKLIAVLFPFILRTTIIKKLGAEYAGLNSLFTSILQVLSLADLGFSSAMVYSMYIPLAICSRHYSLRLPAAPSRASIPW